MKGGSCEIKSGCMYSCVCQDQMSVLDTKAPAIEYFFRTTQAYCGVSNKYLAYDAAGLAGFRYFQTSANRDQKNINSRGKA